MKVFFSSSLVRTIGRFGDTLLINDEVYEWLISHVGWGAREAWRPRSASQWHWWYIVSGEMIDSEDLDASFPLSAVTPVIEFENSDHAMLFKLTWGGM
jgi:hypothetical protein